MLLLANCKVLGLHVEASGTTRSNAEVVRSAALGVSDGVFPFNELSN
jgi:hypothetical protein